MKWGHRRQVMPELFIVLGIGFLLFDIALGGDLVRYFWKWR